jgi:hypothetical protein
MGKTEYLWWCFVVSAILGGSWGGLLYWFNEIAGISIGFGLFLFAFVVLVNMDSEEEEELPQHNRRFNDL